MPREQYAKAGVMEYWLIDARSQSHSMEIQHLTEGAYPSASRTDAASPSWALSRYIALIQANSGAPEGEHRIRFDPGTTHMQASPEIALGKKMPVRYLEFRTSKLKQVIVRGDNVFTVEVDPPTSK